jgi:hypothetical protein
MQTRSQTIKLMEKKEEKVYYGEFNFDFDESSRAWNANKKKVENACYIYVCGHIKTTGKKCMNKTNCGEFCRFHKKNKQIA